MLPELVFLVLQLQYNSRERTKNKIEKNIKINSRSFLSTVRNSSTSTTNIYYRLICRIIKSEEEDATSDSARKAEAAGSPLHVGAVTLAHLC